MKKREKKLQLHRETVLKLDTKDLVKAQGGIDWTGCMSECTECGGVFGKFDQIGN
jgi:hypothetical protein